MVFVTHWSLVMSRTQLLLGVSLVGVSVFFCPSAFAQTELFGLPIQDTYIRHARPDENYGFQDVMLSGNVTIENNWRTDTLIQFELPEAPDGQSPSSATLELFNNRLEWANRGSAIFGVTGVLFEWSEEDDTWNTLDADNAIYDGTVWDAVFFEGVDPPHGDREDTFPDEWVSWDVTDVVQFWYDGNYPNYGLAIIGSVNFGDDSGAEIFPQFRTKDFADEEFWPRLAITFDDASIPGDFDNSGVLDMPDIDLLSAEVRAGGGDLSFDLNSDGQVNQEDRRIWVEDLKQTFFGDSNLDSRVDVGDLNNLGVNWQIMNATSSP